MAKGKPQYIDMTGERYGRVEVLEFAGSNENGNALWKCRCDCGVEFITCRSNLRNGTTKSCGCLRAEKSCYNARKVYNKVY